jgi:cystathionine beta-lyase family protein involved in aluminum resistance
MTIDSVSPIAPSGPSSRTLTLLSVYMRADLVMGSLIKNAGGTLAPGGGYVAGRADLVSAVGARLAAPGIGTDAGGVPGTTLRLLFQGVS